MRITNSGTIESTDTSGRAINAGGSATAPRTLTLINNATGIIRSENDAIRINRDITGGTVHLTNAGTILSTVDGQAIDFDTVASTAPGDIQIDNLAGGVIQSTDADALRPGEGAVVNNAGTIYAGKVVNTSSDGVDFQGHSGTVNNLAGGVISGARHGITTDTDVTVINYGTIIGRNGSGIGSDGTATVINYGRITGAYDGSGNGDGDGIDIDAGGFIENYGVIEALGAAGVHSDGRPNGSDGATIGGAGGTVINHAGATIFSAWGAVPITQGTIINDGAITGNSVGLLFASGSGVLTNTGTVWGGVIGAWGSPTDDSFTNSGTISSPETAVQMGDGNDQLTLLPGSVLIGTVDGGDGIDQVTLAGDGAGSFAGAVNFEHLQVASGDWTLTGASAFANGTTIESGAALTGSADVLIGAIDDSGTLTVDQPTDGIFAATLTGAGRFIKAGTGTLTLGDQAFTGATRINGGALLVNGALPSAVTVGNGATLGGTGSVGSALLEAGGAIAPGAGGTLRVNGDLVQQAGSIYVAHVVAGQTAAALAVSGSAVLEPGALIMLSPDTQSDAIGARYTLLLADGGITGSYAIQQDPQANIELRLDGDGNRIDGVVARTAASLVKIGITRNQISVAGALAALGTGNGAYAALTLDPSDAAVRGGLSQLAGEVHASIRTAMTYDALGAEDTVRGRLDDLPSTRTGLWAQFLGGHGRDDGAAGAADVDRDTIGGIGGVDAMLGEGVRVGVAGGYTRTTLDEHGLAGHARIGTTHVLAYAGADRGRLQVRGAVGYAWNHSDTRRSVAFTGFSDQDNAHYRGNVLHGFGEVGYALPYRGGTVAPFVRITAVRVHTDGFEETGGAAALSGRARSATTEFSDVGARLTMPVMEAVNIGAGLSWRHAYDRVRSDAALAFAGGGSPFDVTGTSLSRDAANPTLDIVWAPTATVRLSAGYAGVYGDRGTETRGRIALAVGF